LEISPAVVPKAAYFALVVFACAFLVMGVFYFARSWARALVENTVGLASKPLAEWLSERVERVSRGLSFLPRVEYTLPFVAVTTGYWLLNAAAAWLLGHGCGLHSLGFAEACVLTGVLALGIMVPNAPGFFGAFQFSAYAALSLYLPEEQLFGAGSTLVFLLFVAQNGIMLVAALISAPLLHVRVADALRAEERALDS
jgi:hypothetical protein